MSTIRVNNLQNPSTTNGGISIDTSGHVTVDGVAMPNAGPLSNRNLIINGDMRIDQRGSGAVTTSGAFPVDRWTTGFTTAGAVSAQQSTAVTPDDFGYSIACTVTTADATTGATDQWNIQQHVEGFNAERLLFGTANAQNVTVSFWVRGSVTGTYCVTLLGSSNGTSLDRSYVSEYTIASADTWEYKTITVPGDTGGTWHTGNGRGLTVRFGLTAGTNLQQATGSWGTTNAIGSANQTQLLETLNATWHVTGVQVEAGSVATPFEHRSYGQELALCQRYYFERDITTIGFYANAGGHTLHTSVGAPVTMRATPTTYPISGSTNVNCTVATAGATETNIRLDVTSTTSGQNYAIGGIIKATAEL